MTSPDIRAGVSLLIAALSAEGKSTIHNIEQIDRGYQDIEYRLNNIGADIRRNLLIDLYTPNVVLKLWNSVYNQPFFHRNYLIGIDIQAPQIIQNY